MTFDENELFDLSISNGILYLECRPNITIDFLAAKSILSMRMQLQADKVYPVLFDMRGVKDSDKPGRDYLSKFGFDLTKAVAVLVNPGVSSIIASFYLKRYISGVPIKMFTEKLKAVEYLNTFK